MKLFAAIFVSLATSAAALHLQPPKNGWAKTGSKKELICKSSEPITSCSWDTPYGKNYALGDGLQAESGRLEYVSSSNLECGIVINSVEAKDDGVWACNVGVVFGKEVQTAEGQAKLHIAQKPEAVLLMEPYDSEYLNVTEEEVKIKCVVENAMPEPTFTWILDQTLLENVLAENERDGQTWIQTLTYVPSIEDHNKTLTCKTTHIGFEEGDVMEASTTIVFTASVDAEPSRVLFVYERVLLTLGLSIAFICLILGPCYIRHWVTTGSWCRSGTETNDTPRPTEAETSGETDTTDECKAEETETASQPGAAGVSRDEVDETSYLSLKDRFMAYFRKTSDQSNEEDVELGNTDEKASEEVTEKAKTVDDVPALDTEEKPKTNSRFSLWKLIRIPSTVAKTEEKEENVNVETDKEKAAAEEEGEKVMKELEPEDKPEKEVEESFKEEPQEASEKENRSSPRNTPV